MKITATKTFEAEISKDEVKRIALQCIRAAVGWKANHYVQDGKLYITHYMSTTHSWDEEILVGEATPDDLAAQRIIKQILSA